MLWGENRGKWKSQQSPGVKPRTPLAWATSALPLSHNSRTTTSPHNPLLYVLHILSGCQVCDWGIQYHLWLSSCCGSVAEHWRLKPEVSWVRLPLTAGFLTFLYFRLITSKFIYGTFYMHSWKRRVYLRGRFVAKIFSIIFLSQYVLQVTQSI